MILQLTEEPWGTNGVKVPVFVVYHDKYQDKRAELNAQGFVMQMTISPWACIMGTTEHAVAMHDHKKVEWFILGFRLVMKWPTCCPQHPHRPLCDGSLPFCEACYQASIKLPELISNAEIQRWERAWQQTPWH